MSKVFIRNIAPDKEKIVKLYTGKAKIFEHYGIERQIKSAFGQTVSLRAGGYLIIEHTEALHVIDVNSGKQIKPRGKSRNNRAFGKHGGSEGNSQTVTPP
jgi:Rne/Rng family ribonuclease